MKEHLTLQGIQKIINIKATLNYGLSKELQLMFPETIPVPRPLRETCVISHSQWIAGFTTAEGNFSVLLDKGIFKSLLFKITQHEKDEVLLTTMPPRTPPWVVVDFLSSGRNARVVVIRENTFRSNKSRVLARSRSRSGIE